MAFIEITSIEDGINDMPGVIVLLAERIDEKVGNAMKVWREDEDENDVNPYASRSRSAQSSSTYWTVGNDDFEFCLRLSDHKAVACCSKVDLNVNLSDFTDYTTDDCGDEIWSIDYDVACEAVDAGIAALLEKIA